MANRKLEASRSHGVQLLNLLRNLVDGAKQLRLVDRPQRDLLSSIRLQESAIERLDRASAFLFAVSGTIAAMFFLLLIAVMMYGHISDFVQPSLVTTYTLTIFFMISPLQNIGGSARGLSQANVALKGIESLRKELTPNIGRLRQHASRSPRQRRTGAMSVHRDPRHHVRISSGGPKPFRSRSGQSHSA